MRLVFINRFFHPDESATSLMLSDLVEGLTPLALDMHVITAAASYTGTAGSTSGSMDPRVTVTRLPNLPISQQSLLGRLLNFIAFYLGGLLAGASHVRRGDLVICLTDPPLMGLFAVILARLKGADVIHWVQDIYPETATRLGYGTPANPIVRLVTWLRDWAWKKALMNVVIGERMRDMLRSRGVADHQIMVIQNWAGEDEVWPLKPEANSLRSEWGYEPGTLVIGYSGNLGRAHDANTMLEAASLMKQELADSFKLLFIGGGAKHALVEAAMGANRLAGTIDRRPYRPRSELPQSLNVPDIHWLSLEPVLEGLIVPSKFYGAAAVGKPIIFIGDENGEVARLIRAADCGASFAKGDARGVADFVLTLERDPALRSRLGANARTYCLAELSRTKRLREWREMIQKMQSERL
ncbi:glycosyltransferase family 4 protein [Porphyrobacter sp. AAP60]|uniref:glycosyltransferase family 4 protein n=1 Tax=Porphyrobacter sp. AAP60 TaxID=1523423 RepID=UPI0006B9C339|nr:glycosyltransferase family 4 protein [Porphyrobacter sp. AAP60]KPF63269.1 hypothetical protein IP79_10285 [Porphyrobacter sp. AAP60]